MEISFSGEELVDAIEKNNISGILDTNRKYIDAYSNGLYQMRDNYTDSHSICLNGKWYNKSSGRLNFIANKAWQLKGIYELAKLFPRKVFKLNSNELYNLREFLMLDRNRIDEEIKKTEQLTIELSDAIAAHVAMHPELEEKDNVKV